MRHISTGLSVLPCLLQVLILPFCPESPGYLLINKQDEDRCREGNTYITCDVRNVKVVPTLRVVIRNLKAVPALCVIIRNVKVVPTLCVIIRKVKVVPALSVIIRNMKVVPTLCVI